MLIMSCEAFNYGGIIAFHSIPPFFFIFLFFYYDTEAFFAK